MPLFCSGEDEFEEHCQECHSTNIETVYNVVHLYLITGLLLCCCSGFPLARMVRLRICRNCEMKKLSDNLIEKRTEMGLRPYHTYVPPLTTNQQLAVLAKLEDDEINEATQIPLK
uniref:LITAF domain-containing protein n=1 Tax=Parastrongyloides trichosuri TaxID=131310 RepID=A0A0N4Z6H0_PARTI